MKLSKLLDIKRQINKPEYWYNPSQILKRISYKNESRTNHCIQIKPSGKSFYLNENEVIGRSILTMGVYDLVVAETIKRIIQPGDLFLDVGANIGYFSRLALEWGAKTQSFEPHPKIFEKLQKNVGEFEHSKVHSFALSDQAGEFDLYIPKDFGKNEGVASLEPMENSEKVKVKTDKMDDLIQTSISLLKIDVEGHELSVFKGARGLLELGTIENILFEDFNGKESPSIQYLSERGYQTFGLLKTPTGPKLLGLNELHRQPAYEPPNFIASKKASKIRDLFKPSGWKFYS